MIPITAKYIQDYFWLHRTGKTKHSIEKIETIVCTHYFKVSIDQIYQRTRVKRVVECRHIIWWILRRQGMTLQAIADQYLMSDHTTIINGLRKVNNMLDTEEYMKRNIAEINKKLG